MVGLSVILESSQGDFRKTPPSQILSKASAVSLTTSLQTPPPPPPFRLGFCCLCRRKLLPGNDIYMYKGDKGFCSVECRCRQILMDEEASLVKDKWSSGR